MPTSRYTVLAPGVEIRAEVDRKKSRFLAVMRRTGSPNAAQELVDQLRKEHHAARHHCSAWLIGADRRVQRANDDGEPSGTAGTPMLEALTRTTMPTDSADLSDVAVVVVRWFGGTLLGAGGLVSAYSDSVIAALGEAQRQSAFVSRQRMRVFTLPAPIAEAGRWENELRSGGITVRDSDYAAHPGSVVFSLAVPDDPGAVEQLGTRAATLSSGNAYIESAGTHWTDIR